jgi:hypothetical protein
MTRVYRSSGANRLPPDTAAAQLKRLAEQCGVSGEDLAALPDAPHRRSHERAEQFLGRGSRAGHCVSARRADPARLARRRRWAASGWLPPQLAAQFTTGELAVLSVVAWEHQRSGRCTLPIAAIAQLCGAQRTTVQNALRAAKGSGLLSVRQRRHPGRKSQTNVIEIVSKEWTSWLARRARSAKERAGSGSCRTDTGPNAAAAMGAGRPGRKIEPTQEYLERKRRIESSIEPPDRVTLRANEPGGPGRLGNSVLDTGTNGA